MSENSVLKLSLVMALLSIVTLFSTGCSGGEQADSSSSNAPIGKPAVTPTPISSSASPNDLKNLVVIPLDKNCEDVITAQELYDFNPNFAYDPSLAPVQPSIDSIFKELGGITCSYMNLSSGAVIQISISRLDDSSKGKLLENLATTSTPVPSMETETRKVFFNNSNGSGLLEIVQDAHWISLTSQLFGAAEDAFSFISPSLENIEG